MRILDLNTWNRKEHFEFFSKFEEPFFGIVTEFDVTRALQVTKEKNYSFFAYYLHKSMLAVNSIEEFRYRIVEDKVAVYNEIHGSATIGRDDHTFGFSFIPYHSDFQIFNEQLNEEIARVKQSTGLNLTSEGMRKDVVHYSTLPWNTFTGLSHARSLSSDDSAPKIVFGKIFERDHKKIMSMALNLHHGLADGWHAAKHFELFQNLLNE